MDVRKLGCVWVAMLGLAGAAMAQDQVPSEEHDALIATITAQRLAIEQRLGSLQRTTLTTASMREQIKQKWQKVDFYTDGAQVVRIKSYPHPGISTRTEEFYFNDGQLILAYIEDNGTADSAPNAHDSGKEYYYQGGKFVAERNLTKEEEGTIRQSDEERLEQEAAEYLALYAAREK